MTGKELEGVKKEVEENGGVTRGESDAWEKSGGEVITSPYNLNEINLSFMHGTVSGLFSSFMPHFLLQS